jgi:hypothetical protein
MQLEAWGFRNPYGIGFDPFNPNLLFVSNNGAAAALPAVSRFAWAQVYPSQPITMIVPGLAGVWPARCRADERFAWTAHYHRKRQRSEREHRHWQGCTCKARWLYDRHRVQQLACAERRSLFASV